MQKSSLAGLGFDQLPELLKPEDPTRTEKVADASLPDAPLDVAAAKAALSEVWAKLPIEARPGLLEATAGGGSSASGAPKALTAETWALVPFHLRAPLLAALQAVAAAVARNPAPGDEVVPRDAAPATNPAPTTPPRKLEPGDEWPLAYTYPPAVTSAPSPADTEPSIPLPGQMPSSPPDASPPLGVAAPAAGGCKLPRKTGRPRLHPDRVLTQQEKAKRYRQRRRAVSAKAMTGDVDAATLSHKDLCLAVARILNRRNDLELQQIGTPLVKELQRRLKGVNA